MNMKSFFLGCVLLFSFSASAAENCFECHAEVIEKAGRHEAAVFSCEFCHAGHEGNSDRPANLLAPVNDLCFQCHDAAMIMVECHPGVGNKNCSHPIFGHPVSGPKDPLQANKEFSCASCHNPHSAQMEKLFRYDYEQGRSPYEGNYCAVCHWDYAFPGEPPVTPPWSFKKNFKIQ